MLVGKGTPLDSEEFEGRLESLLSAPAKVGLVQHIFSSPSGQKAGQWHSRA